MPKRSTGKKTAKNSPPRAGRSQPSGDDARSYTHPEADAALRPDVGGRWGYAIVRDPRETFAVVNQWA